MKSGVDILDYPNYLEVWNHAQFLKNLECSPITAQDEKMLSKLSSAPRFPGQYAGTKRNGMSREQKCDSGYSAECVRIHAVKRAKPLPGHRTLGTRQNAPIQILYPQRGQKTVSQSVFAQ